MAKLVSKKRQVYPTKTTLNLAERERTINSPHNALPIFLVLLLVVGVFAKFAVIDQLTAASAARAAYSAAETRLAAAQEANSAAAVLTAEYNRYSYHGFTDEEKLAVDRMDILDLLEKQLMPAAQVQSVSVVGNLMSVSLSGVTLQKLSDLMRELKTDDIVTDVAIFTAGTQTQQTEGDATSATMTITLTQAEKGGDAQ